MGVTAGVPPRVEAGTKAALLDLVDGAVGEGWSTARACSVLELDSRRCRRWQHRRGAGRLDDNTAGGTASHAITPFERRAIVELFERWGDIDGGYRKLAHRGSYENLVWVSPSTLYRVLAAQGLVLPARPQRAPAPTRPLPDWIEWKRHQIWIYDITHFPAAGRVAYAILDVVTRKWLDIARHDYNTRRLGGFNRWSQHLEVEVSDGTTARLDGDVDGEAGDAVAGSSACSTRFGACVLGQDCRRSVERGRGDRVWRVGSGRVALVPRAWRDAVDPAQPSVGQVSLVR